MLMKFNVSPYSQLLVYIYQRPTPLVHSRRAREPPVEIGQHSQRRGVSHRQPVRARLRPRRTGGQRRRRDTQPRHRGPPALAAQLPSAGLLTTGWTPGYRPRRDRGTRPSATGYCCYPVFVSWNRAGRPYRLASVHREVAPPRCPRRKHCSFLLLTSSARSYSHWHSAGTSSSLHGIAMAPSRQEAVSLAFS